MRRFTFALSICVVGLVVSSCAVGIRQSATEITETSATLNGQVLSTTGGPGSWYIQYGATGAGSTEKTPTRAIEFAANEAETVSEPVDGLDPGTTYAFAVCAEDSENPGDPFCSPDQTFTTDPDTTRDTVTGRAGQFCGGFCVTIDARSGPSGEDPTGGVGWHTGGGLGDDWSGEVTCLSVTGSSAVIGFSGARFALGSRQWAAGLVRVTDKGGPDSALDTFGWADEEGPPDQGQPLPGPTDCSSFPGPFPGPVSEGSIPTGDIVVTDAEPPATTKQRAPRPQ